MGETATLTNAELAAELVRLGIAFVESSNADRLSIPPRRELFLAALASSSEARLRMALIPLLLARPEFVRTIPEVMDTLLKEAQITLMCYYTAAMLLQQKYAEPLADLAINQEAMPHLFSRDLGLPQDGDVDALLKALGERHAILSYRSINWYGTYEQAIIRFIRRLQMEREWADSPVTISPVFAPIN